MTWEFTHAWPEYNQVGRSWLKQPEVQTGQKEFCSLCTIGFRIVRRTGFAIS